MGLIIDNLLNAAKEAKESVNNEVLTLQGEWTFKSFLRIYNRSLYFNAAVTSVSLAAIVSVITLIIGYPLAYLIAKTEHVGRNTFLMILASTTDGDIPLIIPISDRTIKGREN